MRIKLANLANNLISSLLAIVKVIINNVDIIRIDRDLIRFLKGLVALEAS